MRIKLAAPVLAALLALVLPAVLAPAAGADEGMWTFDNFPSAKVKAAYGFSPDKAWLDRVQKASVRLEGGCSGSVVSKDGLVLTNHHCVADCLLALSSAGNDVTEKGFLAPARNDERICPAFEVSILQSINDVTERVKFATAEAAPQDVAAKRRAEMSLIEREGCHDDPAKRCQVVSLYRGGQYKLYRYDRYDDVRLVFAPEQQAASFGGDPDNFNFPRYDFDMSVLRLYRDGKPVTFSDPLKISAEGAREGDLVFVSGHPGSTDRLLTIAQLDFERDHFLPWRVEYLAQMRGSLLTESTKGEEEARQVYDALSGVENSVKVFKGERGALVEPAFFATKVAEEKKLRDALAMKPGLKAKYGDPFGDIEKIMRAQQSVWLPYQMLESRFGGGSVLLADARRLVRGAAERAKPDGQRLAEFSASRSRSLERIILAEAPVHPALEQLEIEFWLNKTREYLGADDPAVKAMFGKRSAAEIALDIISYSQLADASARRKLWDNPASVTASTDPAIVLARTVDAAAREARTKYETTVSGPLSTASEKVAGLRFDVLGENTYPDATFTLRLSYGAVKGWTDPVHGPTPAFTYVSGLWERATGAFPFNLGSMWVGAKAKLAPGAQMNMVSTNDVTGGNSGSPVLDRQGRVVGLAFDGNIHSLGGAYGFDPALNRTVSVASPILFEALRKVYGANALADELQGK
ncbi:MAG: S46 family peptidase [Alphaproteobacteria bacterium]